jgi:hypothetical protein
MIVVDIDYAEEIASFGRAIRRFFVWDNNITPLEPSLTEKIFMILLLPVLLPVFIIYELLYRLAEWSNRLT